MEKVIRYKCEYCDKEFRTPNRHQCKYDPKFKNCYTCKHNHGFEKDIDFIYQDRSGVDYHGQERNGSFYVLCALDIELLDTDGYTIAHAGDIRGYIDCDSYEFCGCKWFANEYHGDKLKRIIEENEEEDFIF